MTRARLDLVGLSLEWLQKQLPGGSPPQLVDLALLHVKYPSNQSSHNQRPDETAWYNEAKAEALRIVAGQVPELADECERQIRELPY